MEKPVAGGLYRDGSAEGELDLEERRGVKIPTSLFPWPLRLECSQGMLTGVRGWDNGMSRGTKVFGEGLCPLEMGTREEQKATVDYTTT